MKKLTTKAAWRLIAQEYEMVANGGSSKIAQIRSRFATGPQNAGICTATYRLRYARRITREQETAMDDALRYMMESDTLGGFFWPRDAAGMASRVVAATLMAEVS